MYIAFSETKQNGLSEKVKTIIDTSFKKGKSTVDIEVMQVGSNLDGTSEVTIKIKSASHISDYEKKVEPV